MVGVAVAASMFACKEKPDAAVDAAPPAASVSAAPSTPAQPSTTVAATPPPPHVVPHASTAPSSAPPLPAATVDQVSPLGLGSGSTQCPPSWTHCCPPGWVATDPGSCNRPCKKDGDCHGSNKCKNPTTAGYCG